MMRDRTERDEIRAGRRITWTGVAVNAALALLKAAAGVFGHSHALIADAVHSLSDFITDGFVLVGIEAGRRGPDADHHFGHGRQETLAALGVGIALVSAGAWLIFDSARGLRDGATMSPTGITLWAAALSIAAKEVLYRYTVRVGHAIGSPAIMANAWHHRTDALSSVAVLLGVGAAWLNPAWAVADRWAAVVVGGFILKVGLGVIWTTLREFTDTAPSQAVLDQMHRVACAVEGVMDIHALKVRSSRGQYLVQVDVEVDGDLSVSTGHAIGKTVKERLLAEVEGVVDVIVHVDPVKLESAGESSS